MSTPLNFLQASVRADELVARQNIGIGTDSQSSELHIKADAPEIRLEDRVGAEASQTATRIYADSGNTYIQSGLNFTDGTPSSNIVFGSMGNATQFVNIGAHGIETTGKLFVNNLEFTQTQGLDQILNVSNTTSNIMTLTNTSDDALNVAGGMTLGSNLAVNTDDLFVDTQTGRVGIGTTNPTSSLHVYGNILGHPVIKTRTITKGSSLSEETETFTLNADENRIVLNNNQGSVGSTRRYYANFTSGVPTTVGTILHLEINSQRINTDATGRGHQSVIQFNGTAVLDTGYIILSATGGNDSYERQLQRTIILTDDGWKDYSMYPKISSPTTDDALIFSTTSHATATDLGQTELTERMRITDTGNVGIGTVSPSQTLDVDGTASISGVCKIGYMTTLSGSFSVVSGVSTNIDTSIPLVGGSGGGLVVLYISINRNNEDNTSSAIVHLRMRYSGTWSEGDSNRDVISNLGSMSVPSFSDTNSYLRMTTDVGGNYEYSAHILNA